MGKSLLLYLALFTFTALAAEPTLFDKIQVPTSGLFGAAGTADTKSALEVRSTTKAALLPRMTTTQRDAIASPPTGSMLFNTTTGFYNYYNGTVWRNLASIEGTETLTNKTLTAPIINQILFTEAAAPSTPAAGKLAVYAKTDKKLYRKTSDGNEFEIGSGGGGGSGELVPNGTGASPVTITAAGGITATTDQRQLWYVVSAGGAVPITANPSISAGTTVGQEIVIFGTSATDYITLSDGNGISLNGPINLHDNAAITLIWNGSVWSELSRR